MKSKISGGQPVITKAPERGNVVNLMDALRRSIEEERRPPAPSLGKAQRRRKRLRPEDRVRKSAAKPGEEIRACGRRNAGAPPKKRKSSAA